MKAVGLGLVEKFESSEYSENFVSICNVYQVCVHGKASLCQVLVEISSCLGICTGSAQIITSGLRTSNLQ